MGKKPKYNTDTLKFVAERDNGNIIGNYDKITRNTKIMFKCNCGVEFSKIMRSIVKYSGLFCRECTCKNTQKKTINTNLKKYGTEYGLQNINIKEKRVKTVLDKYGVDNISKCQNIKEKKTNSSIKKYGVNSPVQHIDVINKRKKTNLERYGVEHSFQNTAIKNKGIVTNLKKYGVNNPFQAIDIKEKIKKTNLEKYGVEYASQNQEIQEKIQKNSKKFKEYVMPSGIIRKVQGYEPFALDILIQTYNEEQIKTDRKDVPRIKYIINQDNKYYFPDIYILDENKIIEVKSLWTLNLHKNIVNQKKEACIAQGYNYEIWCFNEKGEIIDLDNID